MSKSSELADQINAGLNSLHDTIVDGNPFLWSDSEGDQQRRKAVLDDITEKFRSFVYVPRTKTVNKILLFGVGVPLISMAILYLTGLPADEETKFWAWAILIAAAAISAIAAAIVADDPNIGSELALAVYAIPKGWSFSCVNRKSTWEAYCEKFPYFKRGDENRYIGTRIWGYADKLPFQLFHFHWDDVQESYNAATKTYQRIVIPNDRYGMFCQVPELKVRFRVTETEGDGGLGARIELEYNALNKAVNIYCDPDDELQVRKFLSPAVQEVMMLMSDRIGGMHIDFYPGFMMIITKEDFLSGVHEIELDRQATRFLELIEPAVNRIETFRTSLADGIAQMRKYND